MSPEISERAFEEAIECALLRHGPNACPGDSTAVQESALAYGDEPVLGGYHKRRPEDYDRRLCLILADVVDFLLATQPKEWEKLKQHHGVDVKPRFLGRLSREIGRRGALDILRNGVKDSGCKFRLAYFRPSSGLNEELQRLHAANLFSVVRQLRFSEHGEESLDLVLFLNGIPIFTAELKNPLNGQDIEDAIRQYRTRRDPREPLFAYGRCLAHFAIDPETVFVTTRLVGPATRFLPFNQGRFGGAGNPPVPPTRPGFPTDYLWEQIWARVQCDSARRTPRSTSPPDSARSDLHPASLLLRDILDRIRTESQDESEKGRWREQLFMRIALQQPEFELNWIWRWPDWPEREVLTGLNGRDIGIDFVARWTTGERVAIQCKCYEDRCTLGKDEIDKFLGGSQQLVFRLRWIVKVI